MIIDKREYLVWVSSFFNSSKFLHLKTKKVRIRLHRKTVVFLPWRKKKGKIRGWNGRRDQKETNREVRGSPVHTQELPLTVFCVRLGRGHGGVRLICWHTGIHTHRFFARDWKEPSEVLGSLVYTIKFAFTVFHAMFAAILNLKLKN